MPLPSLTQQSFGRAINADTLVMVKFGAPWCAPCRAVAPILDAIQTELVGKATLYEVNIDEEGDLAQKYNVRAVPTFLVFKNGKVVNERQGAAPKAALLKMLVE